ncbi:unnamed protein product [Dibothriocephalus latus]|uniref:RING-type domain-containing protein n=1 Tax=Dibothriocephalus latus TaxID=60516 RepID=A0A3P6S7C1_DIBLA|nr:unnamed protein product [Dibothriocephalus latus]
MDGLSPACFVRIGSGRPRVSPCERLLVSPVACMVVVVAVRCRVRLDDCYRTFSNTRVGGPVVTALADHGRLFGLVGPPKSDFVSASSPSATTNAKEEPASPVSPSSKAAATSSTMRTDPLFLDGLSGEIAREIHDEFLICKICLDNFKSPKSLACLHTFCQTCIENHISAEVTYNKVTDYHHFTCPLCRKRTTLPIGGVKKLPDNFLVSGLADLLKRTRTQSSSSASTLTESKGGEHERHLDDDTDSGSVFDGGHGRVGRTSITGFGECEICGQFSDSVGRRHSATSKCLDCSKLLCEQCVQRHRQIRVTKDHAVFKLATESSIACKDHPEEAVRYYCEACGCCVCVLCTFNDHREHNITNFGEAIAALRTDLRRVSTKEPAIVESIGIHKQEDALIEQLHQQVGRSTLQTIERVPEWECQVAYLESVQTEVSELLEGQDIDILLTRADLKKKLSNLPQLEFAGKLPLTVCPKIVFSQGTTTLGNLVFPDQHTTALPNSSTTATPPKLSSQSATAPFGNFVGARLATLKMTDVLRETAKRIVFYSDLILEFM